MLKFEWKKARGQYASGEELWIKEFCCGGWIWDSCRSKGSDIPPYTTYSTFKINIKNNHFKTEEEAKENLERLTKSLINYLLDKKEE